jgi:hypothetical protein
MFDYMFEEVDKEPVTNAPLPITMDQLLDVLGSPEKKSNPAEYAYLILNGKQTELENDPTVSGCFLTLKNGGELRFCIGKFVGGKLSSLLSELTSSRDSRFSPIS